ncbi:26S protease regulatory subunit 7 [Fasciola hepatica]|uniref:26S protease regulatory subunit 7 n=1 Tax=Fasciola hepatica TaxID=6192 RepID=A0A4E0R5W5_FASHE|nr:26S protease regulatory subunit 7 [Fasciola hepatica]
MKIERLRVLVEMPLLHPKQLVNPEIESPDGMPSFGSPGTGRMRCARAVAKSTDACFIHFFGGEMMQNNAGEGARMVRGLLESVRSKGGCKIFSDQMETLGSAFSDNGAGSINEVQRTVQELSNQLDGFDPRDAYGFKLPQTPWILLQFALVV